MSDIFKNILQFRKGQMHVDGLFLETEKMSDSIYELMRLYGTDREEFLNQIEPMLFELGTKQAAVSFHMYFLLGEIYSGILNRNYAYRYYTELVKIVYYIKKMDMDIADNEKNNLQIVRMCVNAISFIHQNFKRITKDQINKSISETNLGIPPRDYKTVYADVISMKNFCKLPILFIIQNTGEWNSPSNEMYFIHPVVFTFSPYHDDRAYPEGYIYSAETFLNKLLTGRKYFLEIVDGPVNRYSRNILFLSGKGNGDITNKERLLG